MNPSTERIHRFGRSQHLVGVVGQPAQGDAAAPGIIVLNTGLVHRVGPFRMHVELTRRLNALGYPTLRMDLSTMGDSGASAEAMTREDQVRADVRDAIELMRRETACTRFILLGLCRGAQSAHVAASTETGIAGVVFLDGFIYRTLGFRIRHYLPRLFQLRRWSGFLRRKVRQATATDAEPVSFGSVYPPRAQVRDEIGDMLRRGLQLYFLYSGGIGEQFNHPRQFGECYGRAIARHPALRMEILAGTDHTYTLVCDRERMYRHVEAWLLAAFPTTAGAAAENDAENDAEPAARRVAGSRQEPGR